MAELKHFSHECPLTSPKIAVDGICSICYKDDLVELACSPCDFSLCKGCSQLPQKVWHDFHPDHPLEFCLHQYDQKPEHVVCSGCGNMTSGSFYKCKECEIYLDMGCALIASIFRGWDSKDLLHYSHCHLLKRCRPGPDARGSCLLCELPLSPSSVCYGCVHCYSFVHERCIHFPREIAHPVHLAHPLKRLDYTRTSLCHICGESIAGVPFGCLECDFDAHLRCLDSFLRGLMHKSHPHRLIYRTKSHISFTENDQCQICRRSIVISLDSFFYCIQCSMVFHFECLEIPEFVVEKSHHIHPLVCKFLPYEDEFLEYCGVCETMVYAGHHAYSCDECDFLGHIECILRKVITVFLLMMLVAAPSPLYLKDLYPCSKDNTSSTYQLDHDTNEPKAELMVNTMKGHIHVMRFVDFRELDEKAKCNICRTKIRGSPCKCETCSFQAHSFCAELGRPLKHRVHKHFLTLLPDAPAGTDVTMNCDICRDDIKGLSTFVYRLINESSLVSCVVCKDVYHPLCLEVNRQMRFCHPIHPDHYLPLSFVSGSKCLACKLEIKKYGYHCSTCNISFHIKCSKAVIFPQQTSHNHRFYHFWIADSKITRTCRVCAKPCGVSFYGCIGCDFNAHAECIAFPDNVKNQKHEHTLKLIGSRYFEPDCFLCGERIVGKFGKSSNVLYSCKHCGKEFHLKCIMSTDDREAATEEDQYGDIYLMYLERHLLERMTKTVIHLMPSLMLVVPVPLFFSKLLLPCTTFQKTFAFLTRISSYLSPPQGLTQYWIQ
uniref:Uncharacterized protein At2g21850 n=1 Tax=Arabidopsis thaliana TaxID=3702 RepID=Q9SJ14_ARATH|nr:unknown protein [Arabidopsis thaliana]